MTICHPPIIEKNYKGESYTRVTFQPELKRFKMNSLKDGNTLELMHRRVYDLAGANARSKLNVYLNDKKISKDIKSFEDYVRLYLNDESDSPVFHKIVNKRWEIAVALADGKEEQVSMVNSINTSEGGTHVNYIYNQIIEAVIKKMKKINKAIEITPMYVKRHVFLFINCLINNPDFSTQTKTKLRTKVEEYGSECILSKDFLDQIVESKIFDAIKDYAEFNNTKQHKKSDGKRGTIPAIAKYVHANFAGKKQRRECTLILTEGKTHSLNQ